MTSDSEPGADALRRAAEGDVAALGEAFSSHRPRLRRMIQLRLDLRLQGHVDPSDVIQEAYLEIARSLNDYLKDPRIPFYLWIRFNTGRKLQALHRHHLGVHARDASREVSLYRGALPQASSVSLAEQLLGRYALRESEPGGREGRTPTPHPGLPQWNGPDRPGKPMAFSSDGSVLAVAVSPSAIQLIESGTWRPLVVLQQPDEFAISSMGFGPGK